jgi:hypothetical protein
MAIDTLESVQAGGTTQWIRVRGADAANPVLLLIQQGPGCRLSTKCAASSTSWGWNRPSPSSTGTSAAAVVHCDIVRTGPASTYAQHVTILVRSASLAASMSQYLIREIEAAPNIDVRYRTEVAGGGGDGRLEQLSLRHRDTGDTQTEPADGLFVLIGAQPFTGWLPETVGRDQWGYILTGPDLAERWTLQREPYLLETSAPGVFAVGDVRHGSMKRVASAVGDGSIAIRLAHDYLA